MSKKASQKNTKAAGRQEDGQVDYGPLIAVLERLKIAPSEDRLAQFVPLPDKLTLSVAEAAQFSGFSPDSLRDAIRKKRLRPAPDRGSAGLSSRT